MHIKDYMKHIKNELNTAASYCESAKEYKRDGDTETSQYLNKIASDSVQHVEILFKMMDKCIEKKAAAEGNNNVYKEVYDTCIGIFKDEQMELEKMLKG